MKEVLAKNAKTIEESKILEQLNIKKGEYFVTLWAIRNIINNIMRVA